MTTKVIPFDTLPACAQQCPALNAANDVCVPPAVTGGDQTSWTACICNAQSPQGLNLLPTNPKAVCTDVCTSDADFQAIQSMYTTLCNTAGAAPGNEANPNNPNPTSASAPEATSNNGIALSKDTRPWIETHWQWIVFVAVLIVAMVGFSILGVWLKKRHRRKVDARNANMASSDQVAATTTGSNASLPGAQAEREMTIAGGARGMDSGVAPPRRNFTGRSVRSRSSTVNSTSGPVAWGPHQNQASAHAYNDVPYTSYSSPDGPDRSYTPNAQSNPRLDTIGLAHGGPGHESPVGAAEAEEFPQRYTHGAGAQRIREMQSQESIERSQNASPVSRYGTPIGGVGKLRKQ